MPFTRIEVIEGRTAAEKRALLDAVHQSVVQALKVPDECCLVSGRSREAKKTLYRLLVDRLVALGTPARDVVVVLHEPPMENWSVYGGRPASEVALGYDVNV